ncbi:MAG: S9 family peptidase [Actinomycetota bacterium]|nr:S9 family peptidase [Actinomycetota bacterium]
MEPPVAPQRPHERRVHGDVTVDHYFWMRDRDDPAVRGYLEDENAYTTAMTAHLADLRESIFDEIKARTLETDLAVPARRGDYWYSTRTEEGKPYRTWVRMEGSPEGREVVLLDENAEAERYEYFRLSMLEVSPDDRVVAFGVDTDGSERYRIRFRIAGEANDLPDEIPLSYYGAAWASDSEHLFYTVPDATMRPWQVWRHRLGTGAGDDVLVFQEDDERYFLDVRRSRSGGFVFIEASSAVTSDVRYIPAGDPEADPMPVLPRVEGVEYSVDHRGDDFWVVTNDGARDGRLLRMPVSGGPGREVVCHEEGVKLSRPDCLAGHVVVWGRRDGLPAALVVPGDGGDPHYLEMEEDVHELGPDANLEFATELLRYRYESLVTPPSIIDHDLGTGERTLLKQTPVLGGYDPGNYISERVWATASDGAMIPISVVRRRDTPVDGSSPLVVYAYGAYEISVWARFSIPRLSLLDRGVIYALVHVRGGGEMGKGWYESGKLADKPKTFSDLVDGTEHLTAMGYGHPSRVAARGASAGGLTMGATVNLRPDLFRAVVAEVPFVDVVNTMLDETLPLTVIEWEEWGNPNVAEEFAWLRAYSPYENLRGADYPALLVTAGLNDPRVQYWEPAKWVAKMRSLPALSRLVLLKTEMGAGHFARSGRYDSWRDEAFVLAFILDQLGVEGRPNPTNRGL